MATRILLEQEQHERFRKSLWLTGLVACFFIILLLRLFYIQVVQAEVNIRLSKENQMRLVILKAPRGRIFDRNGEVLARNRPSYSISVLPYQIKDDTLLVENLLKIRDAGGNAVFDSAQLEKDLTAARYRRFDLTRIKEDVSLDVVSIIEEHSMQLPGIVVRTEARREYPLGPVTFHVLGYMSEIPEEQFDSLKEIGYHYGDVIGKAGLEKQYEGDFRGTDGREYIEVNAYGKSLGLIEHMPRSDPLPGSDIYTTLDARLQAVADSAFPDSLKGAVVAIDPRNGETLVMFSSPSVDPNIFSMSASLRSKSWAEVALDPNQPLNNRATTGEYPPGSTFKPMSALAGLASGLVAPKSYMPVPCRGAYRFGSRVAHCWYSKGHGRLAVRGAIQKSCNIYFYQLGLKVGDKTINKYAEMFGMGKPTGIDLPVERSGWLSGEEAYNKRFAKRGWKWTRGIVLDLAIGQQQVLTPLQLAVMIGGMGNGEAVYRPFLNKEARNREGIVLEQRQPEVLHELEIDTATVRVIRLALEDVIKPGGTGGRARVDGIPVGGKTGSAENPHGEKTHGLFVCCAPVDNPVIAVAAVVENAGHGGTVAAPIAGAILRYYFNNTDEGVDLVNHYLERRKRS
ncbi:MAG: penicillin-binding protein 2 [Chitinivibrionales bacterium]|nr:penicillin-binding protein 2 [Chitinivibrionales bacterium]MBD3396495.1 penicillin-binding protein 2 [Chitinivibrionales bacterium]